MPSNENKRIAKNTLFLYFRMAIIMIVKLYTSRVLLDVLGIDDYGTWNVVAAFVVSFSFISTPLVTAAQRFLNFDMGKGGAKQNEIFCTSLELFFIIGIVIFAVLETFGVWFINHKMNFAPEKMTIVNWVFQFSIATFFINLIKMAYDAALVASEKMSFYAIFCIIETVLLLIVAFIIQVDIPFSKLIAYGAFSFTIACTMLCCYVFYCNKKLGYTKINLIWDKSLVVQIGSFSGWNLFGGLASMTAMQGLNIMINIFFGVALNAAYGIAMQIRGAVAVIMDNLLKAANPQIVQKYSSGQIDSMSKLLFDILKITYILCFLFIIPMILNMDFILQLWLGENVPQYAKPFAIITMIQILIVCIGNPIDVAIFATGNIKRYQIWLSATIFLNIILSYLFFKMGYNVLWAFYVKIFVEVIIISLRFTFLKIQLGIPIKKTISKVIVPIALISVISILPIVLISHFLTDTTNWLRVITSCSIFIPVVIVSSYYIGLSTTQRHSIKNMIKLKIKWK